MELTGAVSLGGTTGVQGLKSQDSGLRSQAKLSTSNSVLSAGVFVGAWVALQICSLCSGAERGQL